MLHLLIYCNQTNVLRWTNLAGLRRAKDLSDHFIAFKQRKCDELHIVFDKYDIPKSFVSDKAFAAW